MCMTYRVRYRLATPTGHTALIVEDDRHDCFVYPARGFCCHFTNARQLTRVIRLGWVAVPEVAPYTLDELRGLLH